MIHIQVDTHNGLPVYRQIMDQIKYYLVSGVLKAESQLPSIRELAHKLHVNPATVVKAYSELEHQGIIETRQGKGVFVMESKQASNAERDRTLRRILRSVAVEALQIGAPVELVVKILADEMKKFEKETKNA